MRSCLCRGCKNKHTGHAVPWQEGRHGEQTGTITSTGPGVRPCSAWAAVSVPSWRRAELRGQPSCITLMLHLIAWAEVKDLDDSECQISLFCEKKKKNREGRQRRRKRRKRKVQKQFSRFFFSKAVYPHIMDPFLPITFSKWAWMMSCYPSSTLSVPTSFCNVNGAFHCSPYLVTLPPRCTGLHVIVPPTSPPGGMLSVLLGSPASTSTTMF